MRSIKLLFLSFISVALFATLFCLIPLREAAYADNEYTFTYDGNPHEVTPDETHDPLLTYRWYKDGSDTVAEGFSLFVQNVSDSGVYRCEISDGDRPILETEITVRLLPRSVSVLWRTGPKSYSPLYDHNDPFVYNGSPQILYPYPTNVVSGEKLSVTAGGNIATDAGDYAARALLLVGENGTDANNYLLKDERFPYRIEPAPLSVTVKDSTLFYGDAFNGTDIEWSGLFGDAPEGTFVTEYEPGSPAGSYMVGYAIEDPNYVPTVTRGDLSILPRPVTVSYEEGRSYYGDTLVFSYQTEGAVPGLAPSIRSFLPARGAGVYSISGECADENYDVTFVSASYEILPRKLSVRVDAEETNYGDPVSFSVTVTSGQLADGETTDALGITIPLEKPNVGAYTVYPQAKNENYDAEIAPCRVVISPRPFSVSLFGATSVYGQPIVSPVAIAEDEPAYDDLLRDVGIYSIKEPGFTVGSYRLQAACTNPNYTIVFNEISYVISPRPLSVTVYIPRTPVWKGEPLSFSYDSEKTIGNDRVDFRVLYAPINDRGTTDAKNAKAFVPGPGKYQLTLVADDTAVAKNYRVVFSPITPKEFTVYSDENSYNGVKIYFENGYDEHVSVEVETLAVESYEKTVSEQVSLQDPLLAFHIVVEEPTSSKMRVSVPVPNDKLHYSAAIIADGKVSYAPCSTENGYAVFTVSATEKTVVLMADRDATPFLVAAAVLLVFIFIELIVLSVLLKKYRRKKSCVFAFLPLFGANAGTAMGGIYAFALASAIETVVAVGLLVAILVLTAKINRLGKVKK